MEKRECETPMSQWGHVLPTHTQKQNVMTISVVCIIDRVALDPFPNTSPIGVPKSNQKNQHRTHRQTTDIRSVLH